MNVLDIFSGIGGGILGSILCGHRIVCAIEVDAFCRFVLVRRQNAGQLPTFPIWDDVRTFDGTPWRKIVDVVSGGFPCQNISCAGDRTGITGTKSSLWFEMLRIVREVRPRYIFVENSAQLIRNGLDVVLSGLETSGYDAEWCVLGADDVGANHIRKRCWVLGKRRQANENEKISDAACECRQQLDTAGTRDSGLSYTNEIGRSDWWETEPGVGRVVDGSPHRLDRLKGLGNAQVPLCAAVAWRILYERFL